MGYFSPPIFIYEEDNVSCRLSSALKLKMVFFEIAPYTSGMAHIHNVSQIIYMGIISQRNRQIKKMLTIYNTVTKRAYGLYLNKSVVSTVSRISYAQGIVNR